MALFEDNFTDTGNTALSAHTPDVGVGYTLVTGAVDVYQINAGGTRLQALGVADNDAYRIDDLGSADQVLIIRVADTPQSTNHRSLYACVRLSDHNNLIGWRWFGTGTAGSRITRINAGSVVDLLSVDGAEATIRNGWVKIETEDDTIRLFHGGTGASPVWTQVGSVTETFNNTITRQGLAKNGSVSGSLDYIQYMEADVLGGAPAVTPVLTNPTAASTGTGTATGNVTTDTATGTAYAVVTTSETPPSIADIKSGTGAEWSGNQVVSAAGELTFNATALTGGFRWFHFVHTADEDSTVATAGFVDPIPFTRLNKTLHIQSNISGESLTSTHGIPFKTSVETGSYDFSRGSKPITHEVTLRRAFIVVTVNISTTDVPVKVIDNDIETDVVITIPAGQTGTFRDDVNAHTFPGTTNGFLKLEAAESGVTITIFGCELRPTDPDIILSWIGPHSSGEVSPGTSEFYFPPIGTRGRSTAEAAVQLKMPIAATIKDLKVVGGINSSDADQLVGFRKNGVDTALTVTIPQTPPEEFVLTNSIDIVALVEDDEFNLFSRPDPGATIAPRDLGWWGTLEADNSAGNGAFILAVGNAPTGVVITPALVYLAIAGEAAYSTTESVAQAPILFDTRFYGLILRTSTSHTGTAIVTLRRNGQDTNIKVNITAEGQNTYQIPADWFENFDDGDLINYKIEKLTGSPRIQNIIVVGAAIGTTVVDLDSYIQKQQELILNLSSYTQKEFSEQVSFDGVLTKLQQITIGIDSYLTKQTSGFIQLDSYINQLQSVSSSIDALLISTVAGQEFVDLDALITTQSIVATQLDSLISIAQSDVIDLDSYLTSQISLLSDLSSLIQKFNTESTNLDSILTLTRIVNSSIDAILVSIVGHTVVTDLDGLVTKAKELNNNFDSLLGISLVEITTLDSILEVRNQLDLNLSGLISKQLTKIVALNGITQIKELINSELNSYLFVKNSINFEIDAILRLEKFINVLLECIIQKEQLIPAQFDAVLFDPEVEILFTSELDFEVNPGITFKVNEYDD